MTAGDGFHGSMVASFFGERDASGGTTFAGRLAFVRETLSGWGVVFADEQADGAFDVLTGAARDLYGFARFFEVEEARARYRPTEVGGVYRGPDPLTGASIVDWRSPCSSLADLAPILFIEWTEIESGPRRDFVVPVAKEGKGLLVSLDRPEHRAVQRPAVVERAFPLSNLLSKFGFEDGDCLLTREDDLLRDYRGDTYVAIMDALQANGIEAHVAGPKHTSHNPYRLAGELRYRGKLIRSDAAIRSILEDVSVTLWVHDFAIHEDKALFGQS